MTDYLRRAKALGRRLDDPADREAAQSVLDYWTATLFTLPGGLATRSTLPTSVAQGEAGAVNVLLDEFDPATIRSAVADAEDWLSGLGQEERQVARRVMLRLVRLAGDGKTFEPVPATRGSLYEVDPSPTLVDEVIARLAGAGVVRVSKGNTTETDQVALRSPALREEWASFRQWQRQRAEFRDRAAAWHRSDPRERPALLITGDDLEEARSYHDRDVTERLFTEESRKQEIWIHERNRRLKFVYAGVALLSLAGLIGTYLNWKQAVKQQEIAEEQRAIAEERGKILDIRQRLSEMTSLVRTLALLGITTGAEHEIVYDRLDATRVFKAGRPEIKQFFDKYGAILKNSREHGSEEGLRQVKREALNLARSYRKQILEIAMSDEAKATLLEERKVIFAVVESCVENIVRKAAEGKPYHAADPYVQEFFVLYWGEMGLVEGEVVEGAMKQFGDTLNGIDQRIADKVRATTRVTVNTQPQKRSTNRQAIQEYYLELKSDASSQPVKEDVSTATVNAEELRQLREDLEALKRSAGGRARPAHRGRASPGRGILSRPWPRAGVRDARSRISSTNPPKAQKVVTLNPRRRPGTTGSHLRPPRRPRHGFR